MATRSSLTRRVLFSSSCRYTCPSCSLSLPCPLSPSNIAPLSPQSTRPIQQRHFTATRTVQKKKQKAPEDVAAQEPKGKAKGNSAATDDPFDLSAMETDIAALTDRLKNDLSRLRAGGRFNPETVENLRVQPDKNEKQTFKLNDLAQVIPKGRVLNIMVGEKDHVKPVSTAIQSSNLSLTPQPDPTGTNPLLLVVNIPPPTAESRKAVVAEAAKFGDKASNALREARSKQHKKQRAMKNVRPDDMRKAAAQMEKSVEKATGELKKMVDGAKKALESG